MKFKGTILCPFWNMTMPLKELRYAFFGTWLCPKTRFDPINTEHSALCKQDINKIINKTISSYRKPNLRNINITLTEQEYHLYRTSLSILFDLLIRIIKRIIYYTIVKNFKYYLQNNKQKLAYALFATLNDF